MVGKHLSKVCDLLVKGNTDIKIDDLLKLANLSPAEYKEAISRTASGLVMILKRKPKDCYITNYNVDGLQAWQAYMDIQYVLNPACVMYIASYMMKSEKSMGKLLKLMSTTVTAIA